MKLPPVDSCESLVALVQEVGFLPFFANAVRGFSVEECCPPALWFTDEEGPWEWKGPVARTKTCIYGKFFNGKAGFVSREWAADFCNLRRDGYDFDARCDEGLAPYKDAHVYNTVAAEGHLLSKRLKQLCNYKKGGNTGFETVITRLQMQTYLCISDFIYEKDRHGKPYGWGVAVYSTPEEVLGYGRVSAAYKKAPAQSEEDILAQLEGTLKVPRADLRPLISPRTKI